VSTQDAALYGSERARSIDTMASTKGCFTA
jgi:hypothetical protein